MSVILRPPGRSLNFGFWILDFRLTPYRRCWSLSKKFWILDFGFVPQINDAVGEFIGVNTPHAYFVLLRVPSLVLSSKLLHQFPVEKTRLNQLDLLKKIFCAIIKDYLFLKFLSSIAAALSAVALVERSS